MLKKIFVNRGRIESNREGNSQQPPIYIKQVGDGGAELHGWDIKWLAGAGRVACDMSQSPSVWIEIDGPVQVLVDTTMGVWRTLD